MTTPIIINDGFGKRTKACVTEIGQLVVAPFRFSDTKFVELAIADSAYSFFLPRAGERLVITDIIMSADKDVGPDGAIVDIYEATSINTLTIEKSILEISVPQKSVALMIGLNLLVAEGVFVNGKTDDDDVHTTIMGYYVPKSARF